MKKIIGGEPTDYNKILIKAHGIIDVNQSKKRFKLPNNKYVIFLTDTSKKLLINYAAHNIILDFFFNNLTIVNNDNNDYPLFEENGIINNHGKLFLRKLLEIDENYSLKIYRPGEMITDITLNYPNNNNNTKKYTNIFKLFSYNFNTKEKKEDIIKTGETFNLKDIIPNDNTKLIFMIQSCRILSKSNYLKRYRAYSFNSIINRINEYNKNNKETLKLIPNNNYVNYKLQNYKLNLIKFKFNKNSIVNNISINGLYFPNNYYLLLNLNNIDIVPFIYISPIVFDNIYYENNKYYISYKFYYRLHDEKLSNINDNLLYNDSYLLNNNDVIITIDSSYIFYNNSFNVLSENMKLHNNFNANDFLLEHFLSTNL